MTKDPKHFTLNSNSHHDALVKLGERQEAVSPPEKQAKTLKTPTTEERQAEISQLKDIIAWLCENYPETFLLQNRNPLKIGIFEDLKAILKGRHPEAQLQRALSYYTRNYRYQKALLTQDHRYDLEGHFQGEVAKEQKAWAATHLSKLKKAPRQGKISHLALKDKEA